MASPRTSVYASTLLTKTRFAAEEDAQKIYWMITEPMANTFRVDTVDALVYLIKNSVMAICQLDHQEAIVGFLALKDHPLIPSVEPSAWERYLWTKYKSIELRGRNTLFIHMLCWNPIYGRDVVDRMLRSVFMHDPYLHHIAMLKMLNKYPLLIPGQTRAEISFRYVQAVEKGVPGDRLPVLCVADRTELCPRLRVRRAVEEDNDDIIPILDRHAPKMAEMYGEYYVSELISRHPDSERVLLVCEEQGYAVGVIVLNTQINYDELEQSFELSPFSGLRYSEEKQAHQSVISPESAANLTDNLGGDSTIELDDMLTAEKPDKSKVYWLADVDVTRAGSLSGVEPESFPQEQRKTLLLSPFMSTMEVLNMLDEDEEDLEYDIVNIDTTLLRVPQMLSAEFEGLSDSFVKLVEDTNTEYTEDGAFIKVKKSSSKLSAVMLPTTPEPIRYGGRPNAFLLELFAIHPDYDERIGFDILEVAYEMFPDRDYCVVCLPSNHPAFPLLEHFTLVTPLSTQLRFIKETLYVAHVNSVRGEVRVRKSEPYDLPAVNLLLENAPRKEPWMDLYKVSLYSNTYTTLVMLCENQPVGVVVLGALEDSSHVRSQYDLDPDSLHPGNDATVLVGVVSPIFEPHARWFMRDVLRYSRYTSLFWTSRLMAKGESSPARNLMSLAGRMTPVRPRRMIPDISSANDGNDSCRDSSAKPSTGVYALWTLDLPLTSLPKVDVNNSIVVVGASRTGLAFLEALILGATSTYVTFTNITLVSEHGLPSVPECLRAADTCVPRDGRYSDKYLKRIPFYFYIDVMSAVMVKIDRQRKCIHLKCGTIKFYDTLVLTCGKQFQHPEYLTDSLRLAKELQAGAPCIRLLMDDPNYEPDAVQMNPDLPENVMLINSIYQANEALRVLMRMIHEFKDQPNKLSAENRVIIYGDCIEAYSCMSALLELGLGPELLIFVEPYPPTEGAMRVNCFNDETIDERVQATLKSLEIRVFRHSRLVGWRLHDERVAFVRLVTRMHAYQLRAFALFYYGTLDINLHTFKAINECGLVYDGGLIVGPKFETNDPDIFGAGTCTRYSRRLYADKFMHRNYSSEDVGEELARLFLNHLDPFTMIPDDEDEDILPSYSGTLVSFLHSHLSIPKLPSLFAMMAQPKGWEPVTRFKSPLVICAELPGPLYYMKLRAPGPEIPMEVALSLPHQVSCRYHECLPRDVQGHTLQTDKYGNLFRLHLNDLHVINGATCLSTKPFFVELVALLYGKHESFFGQLLARYKMQMIDDLHAYFTQPWMSAVYHEAFDDLIDDIQIEEVVLGNQRFGNFHQVVDRFVTDTDLEDFWLESKDRTSVVGEVFPTECGQSAATRKDVASAWNAMGGEERVTSHMARYLHRQLNTINNQHYAKPNTTYFA